MLEDVDPCQEEEEEAQGAAPEEPSSGEHSQESWGWCQDLAFPLPLQKGPQQPQGCRCYHFAPHLFLDGCPHPSRSGPAGWQGPDMPPWREETLPRVQPPSLWGQEIKAISGEGWPLGQTSSSSPRTLSHPSFQWFYKAIGNHPGPSCPGGQVLPAESEPKTESASLIGCSDFFYTDPMMPPGHRIYNWLSDSSQEVLSHLRLNTPPPIMATRETPALPGPPRPTPKPRARREWLSHLECEVACALLDLPEGLRLGCSEGSRSPPRVGKEEEEEEEEEETAPDGLL